MVKRAFYGAGILIILALIKRFPYKIYVSTHMLIAVAYLVLVFHAAVLMDFGFWTQPVGGVVALLMIGGVLSLTRQIGRNRLVPGAISKVRTFAAMRVTEIELHMGEGWKGHEAGQFSFVTFDQRAPAPNGAKLAVFERLVLRPSGIWAGNA